MKVYDLKYEDINIFNDEIKQGSFNMIAGPCSVESKEQMEVVFSSLEEKYIRAGAYKPRTSPHDFQGLKDDAIEILVHLKTKYNKKIVCEILSESDIELFKEVDIIQIGARNMQNFELLKKVAQLNKPILLKRGMGNTLKEFLSSAEYIINSGNNKVILCERGIRTFSDSSRFTLDLSAIVKLKQMTKLPVFVDPSHAAGVSSLVPSLTLASVACGCDGIIIEVHPNPESALSDKEQQLSIKEYNQLKKKVENVYNSCK